MPRCFVRESPTHSREISPVERPSRAGESSGNHARSRVETPPMRATPDPQSGVPGRAAASHVPPAARAERSF